MSQLEQLLRIRRVERLKTLSEMAHIISINNAEEEKKTSLDNFIKEYTIENVCTGRPIRVAELQNQNQFVGTIVSARELQIQKLNKISQIKSRKQEALAQQGERVGVLESKIAEERLANKQALSNREDALMSELYNLRVKI